MSQLVDEILNFWFEGCGEAEFPIEKQIFWFGTKKETNEIIRKRFGHHLEEAIRGKHDDWIKTPHGSLALIILLDQFSRNLFTGTPREVSQDAKALSICLRGIEAKQDLELGPIQRAFFYLPMEHSEDPEMQKKSVHAFRNLVQSVSEKSRATYEYMLKYALAHQKIIERFGHYPYQNKAMGRSTTQEEADFLAQPGAPFFL